MKETRVLLLVSKRIGLKCLETLYSMAPNSVVGVMTIDDKDDPRSEFDAIIDFCVRNKVQHFIAKDRKESEQIIRSIHTNLCFVAGWYWIISSDTLRKVPKGAIGIHNSLLPKYRGGSPLVWAMINGEREVGVSLFSLAEEMDAGDIWAQQSIKIDSCDYIGDVLNLLESETLSMLRDVWPDIVEEKSKPVPQRHSEATFCAQRHPGDGLINWNWPASTVYNFIRAQSKPYPGAFTYFGSNKLTIWKAHLLPIAYYGTPGQVARTSTEGVYVICGNSTPLVLDEVELSDDGVKRPAREVVKSIKTRFRNTL